MPGERSSQNAPFVREVSEQNVRLTVEALTQRSAVLQDLVREDQLEVVGAMHDVGSGQVAFLE